MVSIALCDDEDLFLDKYEKLVNEFFHNKLMNFEILKFKNSESLLFHLEDNPYRFQIIILDVMMPRINGLEAADKIRKFNPDVNIIFLTSTPDFVFEAFDLKPINYLIKEKNDKKLLNILDELIEKNNSVVSKDNFVFYSKNNMITVPNSEITFFEVFHRIITIHRINEPKYEFYCSIKELEKTIDKNRFIKIYRSYIVNMQYIKRINNKEVELKNGIILPISRNLYNDIKLKFSNYLNEIV